MKSTWNTYHPPRRRRGSFLALVLVAVFGLMAAACGESSSADGETVLVTDGMSEGELTDFAAEALRNAFREKSTIEMTHDMDLMPMMRVMFGGMDIEAEMAADGLSPDDFVMSYDIVMHVDGTSSQATTTIDMGLMGAGIPAVPVASVTIDGVMYQEMVTPETMSTDNHAWIQINLEDPESAAGSGGFDLSAYQQQTFDQLEDVVAHGLVEHNGEQLQHLTAVLRGNELMGQQLEQQRTVMSELGMPNTDLAVALNEYMASNSATKFDILLDSSGQARKIETSISIAVEPQYQDCVILESSQGAGATMEFSAFPDGLVIEAPPAESITTMSELTGGLNDAQGMVTDAELQEISMMLYANCPGM